MYQTCKNSVEQLPPHKMQQLGQIRASMMQFLVEIFPLSEAATGGVI